MRRALASRAEVFRRRYQPLPEILLPDAIDDDASGQRVIFVDNPFRQAEPVRRRVFRVWMQRGGNARADSVPGAFPIAAFEDARLARDFAGAEGQRRRAVWPLPH